ncbi:MAG: extracellular solute-binding protein [Sphaerochaetaceae bacterium]|nr:extracellular solute-binding protein [Sphaerochaetaceae bacterium]
MKKILLALILVSCLVLLVGCGNKKADNKVIIYTAAEEDRIEYLKAEVASKFPNYEVIFQSLGTGNLVAKLQAEGNKTECDIFYDLEVSNAEILNNTNPTLFYDLSSYDFSIYEKEVVPAHKRFAVNGKTDGTIVVNKKVLAQSGAKIPETYEDLLKSEYKGLVTMPGPMSSGTGYSFVNGIVSSKGEAEAFEYFNALNENIKEYTTSGSAPVKAVDRGEVGVGVCLLWQGVQYANKNPDLQVVFLNNEASYNLYTMGMISRKEIKPAVKEVFDYLFNELNEKQCTKYNPDKIYVNQGKAEIPNYPTDFAEIAMKGQFDPEYKQNLLDKWKF